MHKFTKDLLAWYQTYGRTLPWRETTDPYKIMVSEFMLQQTQVPRVIPKYKAFLKTFPTIQDLANASLSDVLTLWSGLGYNRRAKFLWRAAQDVVEKHNGTIPDDPEILKQLTGFGEYTANAVAAFAFNKPVVVIDANVKNVYNKVFGLEEKQIREKVLEILPKKQARDFYNALMDIGSTFYKSNSDYTTYPFKNYCFFYNKKEIPQLKKVKQTSFKDSNRFYRGQILKMLTSGQTFLAEDMKGKYKDALQQLLDENLIEKNGNKVYLPK